MPGFSSDEGDEQVEKSVIRAKKDRILMNLGRFSIQNAKMRQMI